MVSEIRTLKANERAYLEMVKVHEESGMPERYVRDLFVIDAKYLGCFPEQVSWELPEGTPFGWIVRDMGTHIDSAHGDVNNCNAKVFKDEIDRHDAWLDHVRENPLSMEMYGAHGTCSAKEYMYFWWDGVTLMRVPGPHTILDRMRHYNGLHESPTHG